MITGTVVIDLRDADDIRRRCGAIEHAPDGAKVILAVGALQVDPAGVGVLRQHAHAHDIDVQGTGSSVRRWVAALRDIEAPW